MTSLRRKLTNNAFTLLAGAALVLALVPLVSVTWTVVEKGAPAISWGFITSPITAPDDPASGIAPAIVGTVVLVGLAMAIGIPLGVAGGIWLSEYGRRLAGDAFRIVLDAMAATPSIVVGIFVFTVVVLTQHHFSALAGGIALGLMVIPVTARTTEVALRAVPDPLREAGVALGATHTRTMFLVTAPAAKKGITTGAILATARVAGETAPLLFTALFSQHYVDSIDKPISALPTLIFNYIQQPYEQLQQQAWGAAFLLFILVFGANVLVRVVSHVGGRKS